ncbi:MAG: GNAT family N-acetyltransferase [Aliivibrio sp.]|uniref:GNAT family N-acetyltransferase n=1 Tax=Aliivibrio sp. TaxID=1872443 RepID=UPI001A417A07|nr:GNAT family N-acetyltransferase [Aliivibrio sp.]
MFTLTPLTLTTDKIRLVPLSIEHLEDYYQAGKNPALWRWVPVNPCSNIAQTKAWLKQVITDMEQGQQLAFMIFDINSNSFVGSTRLFNANTIDGAIEIGHTFISVNFQRSQVNTHAKYLLLKHAFEQLKVARVEFRTHQQNSQSRQAIARIGATFEGILRKNRLLADRSYRNTALFSIINDEWPELKRQFKHSKGVQ